MAKETELYRKAKRLIEKAERKGYTFSALDHGMFARIGKHEWIEGDIHWIVLKHFDSLYEKFYPKRP